MLIYTQPEYRHSLSIVIGRVLDRVSSANQFITLSFVVRIIEGIGNAGFLTASFAIVAAEFPENVATTFVSIFPF